MLERARIKAELREHLRPKSIVHEIDKGIIRMLSVEICHAITYHDALMKRGLSEMDAVKKIAPLVDQFLHKQAFCLMCGRQFNGWKHILPTLILKAIPVPPHKKPRLKALALCDDCSYYDNRNDNIVETICFAYTCLSNPATLALFKDNLAEWPLFKKWKAAIEMAAFHNVYLVDPELKR